MLTQNESSPFQKNLTINLRGNLMDFSTAKVMGIINLTPDSFYDGGQLNSIESILNQASQMISEGADILDLGAFSSRPGSTEISETEELKRLIPALKLIREKFSEIIISVDTYRVNVAKEAIKNGADIINDISGGEFDKNMFSYIAKNQIPYILMHMNGDPQNMQMDPTYGNVVKEVYSYFNKKINQLNSLGAIDIIIDPGFGFGKTLNHNYKLLQQLPYFKNLNCIILAGMSRKKMIQLAIQENAQQSLNGTTAANTIALLNGAKVLRVHDVKSAKEAISIVDFMQKQ
jgi:dihydropteroate synthase